MTNLTVKPLILGIGAFAVATSGATVLAGDVDETLTAQLLEESTLAIAGAHEEGGCGEKEGDDEGKCGEGQCGEDHDDGEEEEEEAEEE